MNTDRLQILPGTQPGKIRVIGNKQDAEFWAPRILQDREKIRAVTAKADTLLRDLLLVADYYECTPEEVSAMLTIAARDPENASRCFRDISQEF